MDFSLDRPSELELWVNEFADGVRDRSLSMDLVQCLALLHVDDLLGNLWLLGVWRTVDWCKCKLLVEGV